MDNELKTILAGVKSGMITAKEADALLQAEHGLTLGTLKSMDAQIKHPNPHISVPILAAVLFVFFAGFGLFYLQGDITGFSVQEIIDTNITYENFTVDSPVGSIIVSGTLYGEGTATITFIAEETEYLVGQITWNNGDPLTDQASYSPGELVNLINAPEGATYYLDNGTQATPADIPFEAPESTQELLIVANNSGELTTHRIDVLVGEYDRTTEFVDLCEETCVLENLTGIIVVVTEDATLDLHLTGTSEEVNSAPELVVPFSNITINTTTEIELSGHFVDIDNDDLFYSVGESSLVDATIEGSILKVVPLQTGSDYLPIYVSDLQELVQTELFFGTVLEETEVIPNETNNTVTENETINETNQTAPEEPVTNLTTNKTINTTGNNTNLTAPSLTCDNPNPNLRPMECLQELGEEAFPDRVINWESVDRQVVGQFNRVGNLLIQGDVIEYSSGSPSSGDFSINGADRDFNPIPAIWIDTDTGNLHLRGRLYETQVNLQPPAGSYSVKSSRSIYFAYVDIGSGDMHLLGNVIPYRRSLG